MFEIIQYLNTIGLLQLIGLLGFLVYASDERRRQMQREFTMEYIAFQKDWSGQVMAAQNMSVQLFLAEEDPTVDLQAIPKLQKTCLWIEIELLQKCRICVDLPKNEKFIPLMAEDEKRSTISISL